ncbi:hypothetical protein [Streptomyces sp. enrichment culture]|uniref:hypothetical protein n=1 Tax=Streptomyces sp. enrichment culture TaxID=1795815 RepID=UPI003F552292
MASRLPGTWTSDYTHHDSHNRQFGTVETLWDVGHVDYIVSQYALGHHAVLHDQDGRRLYVTDRPLYRHQFVVAPLEPDAPGLKPHHFVGVEEPNGIAVPDKPARAAAQVTRRLLPRYQQALDAVHGNILAQPEPPHRPPAQKATQVLTLVSYPDGVVGAPYASVPEEARMVLYGCRFQYKPHEAAFVLPAAYSTAERALFVQAAVSQLTAAGIGVDFRRAATSTTTSPRPPVPAASNASLTARHR